METIRILAHERRIAQSLPRGMYVQRVHHDSPMTTADDSGSSYYSSVFCPLVGCSCDRFWIVVMILRLIKRRSVLPSVKAASSASAELKAATVGFLEKVYHNAAPYVIQGPY